MRRTTIVIAALSLAFAAFVFYSLFHLEPLQVSGGRLEHIGNAVVVRGAVTNAGSEAKAAGLKVQLFDAAGHRLAEQTLALGKLAPGQRLGFVSRPISAASGAEKFTIQIDHGTNMYGN